MRRLAYIPARGGSKGIPMKNLVDIGGVPLIAHTIRSAIESGVFDAVMVSTDSREIADVSVRFGAYVPFLRYPSVSRDESRTIDSIMSDKERLAQIGIAPESITVLQCTSPLRTSQDIIGAVDLFEKNGIGVVGVCPVKEHPILMRTIGRRCELERIVNCNSTCRRQDMPPVFVVNGAIYVNLWDELSPDLSLNDNPIGYVMSRINSVDIDTEEDLEYARIIYRNRNYGTLFDTIPCMSEESAYSKTQAQKEFKA